MMGRDLIELERDDNAEAKSEPEGSIEQEKGLAPSLAGVGRQPRIIALETLLFDIRVGIRWCCFSH